MSYPQHIRSVLIVGAGPTGLFLAGDLARHGIACRLIDASREPHTAPRAINLHARTLEVFEDLGIAEEVLQAGAPARAVNLSATQKRGGSGKTVGRLSLDAIDSPYPFMFGLSQIETERILEDFAARNGLHVERAVRLVGLAQDEEGVTTQLEHLESGQEEHARFGWVVGCDGLHSIVRHVLGIPFEGKPYEEGVGLIDIQLDWKRSHDEAHVFLAPGGTLMFQPMPGERCWRLAVDLAPLAQGQTRPEPTLEDFQVMANERGADDAMLCNPTWMSYFHVHKRLVPHYRVGKVFLAGDAAHVHSPIGAQGMNTGLQDAYNLAWKLALVIQGAGRPELLDSYEAERRPVAQRVLRNADAVTRVMTLQNSLGREIRNRLAGFLMGVEGVQQRIADAFSAIGFDYRHSPVVAQDGSSPWHPHSDLVAGDRTPDVAFGPPNHSRHLFDILHGTRHVLLLFDTAESTSEEYAKLGSLGQEVEAHLGAYVTVHAVVSRAEARKALGWEGSMLLDSDQALHKRFRASSTCLYLVRPDGYIAYCGRPADRNLLAKYLDRIFARDLGGGNT